MYVTKWMQDNWMFTMGILVFGGCLCMAILYWLKSRRK